MRRADNIVCDREAVLSLIRKGGVLKTEGVEPSSEEEVVLDRDTGEILAVSTKPKRDLLELPYYCIGYLWELAEILPKRYVDGAQAGVVPRRYSPYEADEYASFVPDFLLFYSRHGKLPAGFDPVHFAMAYLYRAKGLENDDGLAVLAAALVRPRSLCSEDGDVALALTPLVVYGGGVVVDDCASSDIAVVYPEEAEALMDGRRIIAVLGRSGALGKERTSLYKKARAAGYFLLGSPLSRGLLVLLPAGAVRDVQVRRSV
ncbi:MAG: hypothetical protein ACP5I3_10710 [Thermoproteus sp.]